jgi:hypothetical protein
MFRRTAVAAATLALMVGYALPASAHDDGRAFGAFALGAVLAGTVAAIPTAAPPPPVVAQPVYVPPPPVVYAPPPVVYAPPPVVYAPPPPAPVYAYPSGYAVYAR